MKIFTNYLMASAAVFVANLSYAAGPMQCPETIELINDQGCFTQCCTQSPPNSGHYVFEHTNVEKVDIRGNSSGVKSLSFPNLQSIENTARISYNQADTINSISFASLRNAGSIEIVNNPGLNNVELPMLQTVISENYGAKLKIQSNAALQAFNAPLLSKVIASEAGTAFIEFRYNHALTQINLSKLVSVESSEDDYGEAYIFISSNNAVKSINMNNLTRLTAGIESISYLIIDSMPELEQISFSSLTELLPSGGEYNFNELTIGHSPKLAEVEFPMLERVSLLQISSMSETSAVKFPRLTELDYLWAFNNCENQNNSMKMYICNDDQPIGDFYLSDNGQCGMASYELYSPNTNDQTACEASGICQTFTPPASEFVCAGAQN
jgi:hypothetical protein